MLGNRLRLARKKAGFSLRALANELNGRVSAQAIGKYERDEITPSSEVLIALCKALGVDTAYLINAQSISLEGVDFRKKASTTAKDRARVEVAVLEQVDRYLEIEQLLELDSSKWETPIDNPASITSVEEAENLARTARQNWDLGIAPIPNMTELLEEKGLKVLVLDLPNKVSGLTCLVRRAGGLPNIPVIVVNQNLTLERRRLTLAHELAHRLISPGLLTEKEEETLATRFAGSFLIPADHIHQEAGKHRKAFGYSELVSLKKIYRVSGAALLVRLRDLQIISNSYLTYAFQSVARSWRTQEPEQLELETQRGTKEPPCRFERLCYRALAEELIKITKVSELLQISIKEVECGLRGPQV